MAKSSTENWNENRKQNQEQKILNKTPKPEEEAIGLTKSSNFGPGKSIKSNIPQASDVSKPTVILSVFEG